MNIYIHVHVYLYFYCYIHCRFLCLGRPAAQYVTERIGIRCLWGLIPVWVCCPSTRRLAQSPDGCYSYSRMLLQLSDFTPLISCYPGSLILPRAVGCH